MNIGGKAREMHPMGAVKDKILALLALFADKTRWKYTCHGIPPIINISILSVHNNASSFSIVPTHGGVESVKLPTMPPSGTYSLVTING